MAAIDNNNNNKCKCGKAGENACSVCGERYCSRECQVDDWSVHRRSPRHLFVKRQEGEFCGSSDTPRNRAALKRALRWVVDRGLLDPRTPLPANLALILNFYLASDDEDARMLFGGVCFKSEDLCYRKGASYVLWDTDRTNPNMTLTGDAAALYKTYELANQTVNRLTLQLVGNESGVILESQRAAFDKGRDDPDLWEKEFPGYDPADRELFYKMWDIVHEMRPHYNTVMSRMCYVAPPPDQVPVLMRDITQQLNAITSKAPLFLEDLAALMTNFFAVHPFACGNGRTARILANVILTREVGVHALLLLNGDKTVKKEYDAAVVASIRRYTGDHKTPAGEYPGTPFKRFLAKRLGVSKRQ